MLQLLGTPGAPDSAARCEAGGRHGQSADPLVLDLVAWVARESRPYTEVMETWRTSCPRLSIWEGAVDRGYVARMPTDGRTVTVAATELGRAWLRDNGRLGQAASGVAAGAAIPLRHFDSPAGRHDPFIRNQFRCG